MPQQWISNKILKRIFGVLVILMGAGTLYSIYADVHLFKSGVRTTGAAHKIQQWHRTLENNYQIQYIVKDQEIKISESTYFNGPVWFDGKVAVYYESASPKNFTFSRIGTGTTLGYLFDHTFFIFRLVIMGILFFVGFKWLFRARKQLPEVNI